MIPEPRLLLGLLLTFTVIFATLFILNLSKRMLNSQANKVAVNISQEIKITLTTSPYFHMLDNSEKKKYRDKSCLRGIVIYILILIFIVYRASGTFSITQSLLFSSPVAVVILLLVIRDMIRFSPGKEIYHVKAFCTGHVPGKQGSYSFVYYNFFEGCFESDCVNIILSRNQNNIAPGNFCELIVTPKKARMQVIDVA